MSTRVRLDTRAMSTPLRELALTVRPGAVLYCRIEIERLSVEEPMPGPRLVLVPLQGDVSGPSGEAYFRTQRVEPFASDTHGSLEPFPSFRLDAIQPAPVIVPWRADVFLEAPVGADGVLWEMSIGAFERDDCDDGASLQRAALVPRDRRTYTLTDRAENGDLWAGPSNLVSTPTSATVRPFAQGARSFRVHGPNPVTLNFVDRAPPARSMVVAPGELITVSDASYFELRGTAGVDYWIEWEVDLV